ncbi:MAG: FAD:protein FMN transferase [Bacteroidota bacterium]
MSNRTKNAIYSLLLIVAVLAVWKWRQINNPDPVRIEGETMATTYHVTYFDEEKRNFKIAIDSVLVLVNQSINNYNPASEVSVFNKSTSGFRFRLPYLYPPLLKAREVVSASQGAFDPTVMPLVNAWGFGPDKQSMPDSSRIDSLLQMVGFEKIQFNRDSIWKLDARVQLDFGGIGQGYGADVIADFLKSKGIKNMLVELGGEGMACGINLKTGKPWQLGILDPGSTPTNQYFRAYVSLTEKAFTTSGNYFNYREVDGQKFSHTISPQTGYPVQHNLLSASVFAADCTTADAWGTALMVMGYEKAVETLKANPHIDAFLIYSTPGGNATFATPGIQASLEIIEN